ncbi:MAG: formate dehydrogenase subunit gamma [Hyphomicrobiaceae bacterium]|nr:formate dehydrogenase subunit gamma [Hyphomicrobiaceae bacterium]
MPLQRKQQQSPWWFGAAWQIFRSCMSIGRVAAMAMVVALASPAAYAQTELPDPGVLKDQAITTPGGSVRPPSGAVNVPGGSVRRAGEVGKPVGPIPPPGHAIGDQSITEDLWSRIRHGQRGEVANPYGESGILIQSQGTDWMAAHNDQVVPYGGWLLLGTLAAIAVFFLVRGRIRIEGGRTGLVMPRFSLAQRIAHWFAAALFILLAISGLIILFGKSILLPVLGPHAFAVVASAAMQGHNLFGPLFIPAVLGILLMFIRGNAPRIVDLKWFLKGGGLFGGHASAGKFNAGQKVWFLMSIVLGVAISVSGVILLFPDALADRNQAQFANLVHGIAALVFIAAGLGHAYIGSIGMEGAFEAMSVGTVDTNWAKEHHDLWYAEHKGAATTDIRRAEVDAGNVGDGAVQGVRT